MVRTHGRDNDLIVAKGLSVGLDVPIIGVHHMVQQTLHTEIYVLASTRADSTITLTRP